MASIIKLQGKKGVTYKAVIRRKGYKTITRTFPCAWLITSHAAIKVRSSS